jgi:hypothetical protein
VKLNLDSSVPLVAVVADTAVECLAFTAAMVVLKVVVAAAAAAARSTLPM